MTGITENFAGNVKVYPNPFSSKTTIEFFNPNNSNYKLSVYSISGKKVFELENITSEKIIMDKGNLHNGIYLIDLKADDNNYRKLIVIEW